MKEKVKILISCHKPSKTINTKYMQPIQVGTALASKVLENCLHDNAGGRQYLSKE